MKKLSVLLLSLSLLFTSTSNISFATVQTPKIEQKKSTLDLSKEYQVIHIFDGDTIKIKADKEEIIVRLLQIDTPELKNINKEIALGKKASEFTSNFLKDKKIMLELDKEHYDKYDRLLAYVYYTDKDKKKIYLNETLVKEGLAKVVKYGENTLKYEEYKKIEKTVRENKKGIWENIELNYPSNKKMADTTQNTQQITNQTVANQKSSTNQATNTQAVNNTSSKSNNTIAGKGKIKGNTNSKGEKIYHVPGGASYDKTDAEEYFDTEEQAQKAGYRRAKR